VLTAPVARLGEFVRLAQRAGRVLASRVRARQQSTLFHGLVDRPCQSFASYNWNQRTMTMYRPGGLMVLSRLRDRAGRYPSTCQSVNDINRIGL
jgi:hypothetical protein